MELPVLYLGLPTGGSLEVSNDLKEGGKTLGCAPTITVGHTTFEPAVIEFTRKGDALEVTAVGLQPHVLTQVRDLLGIR